MLESPEEAALIAPELGDTAIISSVEDYGLVSIGQDTIQ